MVTKNRFVAHTKKKKQSVQESVEYNIIDSWNSNRW